METHQYRPENREVETAVIDTAGERMTQVLVKQGRLWMFPGGSMYVYYEPTHWREKVGTVVCPYCRKNPGKDIRDGMVVDCADCGGTGRRAGNG